MDTEGDNVDAFDSNVDETVAAESPPPLPPAAVAAYSVGADDIGALAILDNHLPNIVFEIETREIDAPQHDSRAPVSQRATAVLPRSVNLKKLKGKRRADAVAKAREKQQPPPPEARVSVRNVPPARRTDEDRKKSLIAVAFSPTYTTLEEFFEAGVVYVQSKALQLPEQFDLLATDKATAKRLFNANIDVGGGGGGGGDDDEVVQTLVDVKRETSPDCLYDFGANGALARIFVMPANYLKELSRNNMCHYCYATRRCTVLCDHCGIAVFCDHMCEHDARHAGNPPRHGAATCELLRDYAATTAAQRAAQEFFDAQRSMQSLTVDEK